MSTDQAPTAEPFPIWVVWREEQPAYGYFATEDIAKQATIDCWEENEPVCPDYSWRSDGGPGNWELLVGDERAGVYVRRHLVYGGAPASSAVSVVPPATNQTASEHLDHLHRITLPDLRRQIEYHQDGKARWRNRARAAEARVAELRQARDRIAELEAYAYGCDAEGCVIPHSSWCEAAKKTAAANNGCTCGRPWTGHPQPHAMHCWTVNPPRAEVEEMRRKIASLQAARQEPVR